MENHKAIIRTKDTGSNKSLLIKGMVPGIVYGKGTEPKKIALKNQILQRLMQNKGFYTKILNLEIDGKNEKVLPKVLQYHPITDKLIHFDFLRIQENTRVKVEVPVEFLNKDNSPGLKKGGVLNVVRRSIELICNAKNIPEILEFDLNDIDIGHAIKISNIELPTGVELTIRDRDFVVATVVAPTVEVEEEPKKEEEGEEAAEGATPETEGAEKTDDKKEDKKEESGQPKQEEKKQEEKK